MDVSEDTQLSSPSRPSQVSSPSASPPEQYSEDETGDLPVTVVALAPESENEQARRQPVTVHKPKSTGTGGRTSGGGGREDCWSEGATSVLIDAWGERFLELTRGNLNQKDWQEVADVVSARDDSTKTAKTDVQCKNRIDTLKKKYKLEKSKITAARTSHWPFFRRLEDLIGRNPHNKPEPVVNKTNKKKSPKRTKNKLQLEFKSCKKKKRSTKTHKQLSKKETTKPVVESTAGKVLPADRTVNGKRKRVSDRRLVSTGGGKKEKGLSEVINAVVKIGEVYERVERAKLVQATEMERQRMVFAKELELQRMQFLLKTQLELTQIKHNNVVKKNMDDDDDDHRDSNDNHNGDSGKNNSNKA